MSDRTKHGLAAIAVLCLAVLLSGCAGTVSNMRAVSADQVTDTPAEGKAMVIFLRPSTLGFAIQSSVFDVTGADPKLVGIVAAKKKVAYQAEPGNHLFMVVGESADFMYADLAAGKTYYALVTPRMGMWKARFSLRPVHAAELNGAQLKEWLDGCEWVEKSPESDAWAAANRASIASKRAEYYAKWTAKPETERPKLWPQDGR